MESTTPTFTRFWPSYINASAFGATPSASARWATIAAVILGGTAVLYASSTIARRKRRS